MIKLYYATEKTNSYRPSPWAWTTDPFPAFRGAGQRYNAFLAVANGFTPWFSSFNLADNKATSDDNCKVIITKKGTRLLVPCSKAEDERILLITARGEFRGGWGAIEGIGAEILWENHMTMHCCPVAHIIARITDPEGYVRTETGYRGYHGDSEIYSWKGGYFRMPTKEYNAAVESGMLFAAHDTIQSDLEVCKAKRAEQTASRAARAGFIARLEAVNVRIEKADVGVSTYELGDDTFFTEKRWDGSIIRHLYTEEEVAEAQAKAEKAEAKRIRVDTEATWKPRFQATTEGCTFTNGKSPWGESQPQYFQNCISVWSVAKSEFVRYDYSPEGLTRFKTDIPSYEEEYQIRLRTKAEAEAKAKAEAEAATRRAEAETKAKAKQAEAEAKAKALGLPSDIQVWKRTGGRTGCSKGWVIRPDGSDRERDELFNENSNRARRYDEGYEIWHQICAGELVVAWSKTCTAAPHEFRVVYRPNTLTEAQQERIAEIQQTLEVDWAGLTGLASGKPSPSVGAGWGLF